MDASAQSGHRVGRQQRQRILDGDNGQYWKDITPPRPVPSERVVSVCFLNGSTGWVLLSQYDEPLPRYDLAFTNNSGTTWSSTELRIPLEPHQYILLPQGDIQFMDASHGWMNLSVESSSNFHFGILFRTQDGGKTWIWTPGPGTAGDVQFIDKRNGWVASPADGRLWGTHDGAVTWNQVSLMPPAPIPATAGATGSPLRSGQPVPARTPKPDNGDCSAGYCGVVEAQGQAPGIFNCWNLSAQGSPLYGVSDDPQFSGSWYDGDTYHGFVSPDAAGQHCNSFDPTGSISTSPNAINGDGQVVGSFVDSNQQTHGFIYDYGNGISPPAPTQYDYTGATDTSPLGISNNGLILGYANLASGGSTYFLLDENNGTASTVTCSTCTRGSYTLNGLNDASYIAGFTGDIFGCADGLLLESALVP